MYIDAVENLYGGIDKRGKKQSNLINLYIKSILDILATNNTTNIK